MNKKWILERLFSVFPEKMVKFIIWYGNRDGRDIDLFIVSTKLLINYGVTRKFPLDVVYMSESFFKESIKNLDPMAIDPILTGKLIYGKNIGNLKTEIRKIQPTEKTRKYLLERAKTFFEWTKHYYRNNNLKETLTGIQFTLTYVYFVKYYQNNSKIISFTDLLKIYKNTTLEESLFVLKKGLFNEINRLLLETKNLLTNHSDMLSLKCTLKKGGAT